MKRKIKIGISVGDLNGIGMEIIIKTFLDKRMLDFCTPIIFGSSKSAIFYRKLCEIQNFSFNTINNIKNINEKQVNLINCWNDDVKISPGILSEEISKYAFISLEKASNALQKNEIDALVTAPINKSLIRKHVSDFIGHTEYLEKKFDNKALMMMISDNMKVACVTSHVALSEVPKLITKKRIKQCLEIMNKSLVEDFCIQRPKIAVMGLNPHAGENGMLGAEEDSVILPAINDVKSNKNILAFGPFPCDSFFTSDNIKRYDGILSMYHDQGLTPFKSLSFSEGVNYTAGLPIIRTSPVHGTGYDIAGKNIANANSFRESIYLSCKSNKLRKEYFNLKSNSLAK